MPPRLGELIIYGQAQVSSLPNDYRKVLSVFDSGGSLAKKRAFSLSKNDLSMGANGMGKMLRKTGGPPWLDDRPILYGTHGGDTVNHYCPVSLITTQPFHGLVHTGKNFYKAGD